MFPQTAQQSHSQSVTQQQQWQMRYGCIAARIGADIQHKLGIDMPVMAPSHSTATDANAIGRKRGPKNPLPFVVEADHSQPRAPGKPVPMVPKYCKAGTRVSLTVEDITRFPDEAAKGHWICKHPECQAEKFKSKKDLLAAHKPNKELADLQQTHVYFMVVEVPERRAKAPAADGSPVIEESSVVLVLSDEE